MLDYLSCEPLHRAVKRLGRQELLRRLHAVQALSAVRGLRFLAGHNKPQTIELALVPWILSPAQVKFFHGAARLMVEALARLPALYARDPAIRRILPLTAAQASWILLAGQRHSRPLALLGRLDSNATFSHARWRETFQMLEPNTVGVGGIHYAPAAASIVLDVLGDAFERAFPGRRVVPMPDPRDLLLDELVSVSRRLGRRLRGVALIENTDFTTGTDEFESLARYFAGRGLKAVVADPRALRVGRRGLVANGQPVDLLYRDCELNEFLDMERHGRRLAALRQAIREGRLISGLLWEFDQKSCWEIFTDPTHARYFTTQQRWFFRRHLPWTRLVRQTQASDPSGARVELASYIRRHKNRLVLKPNTLYGGQGVVVGDCVLQSVWERTLNKALGGRSRYVVQERARIATERFPRLNGGSVCDVQRRVVSGFFVNSTGVGLIGRFSEDPVVNVSRGGGLLSALMLT